MKTALAGLLACAAAVPAAASPSFQYSGYLKDLWHYRKSPLTRAPFYENLSRARVKLEGNLPLSKPPDEWTPPRTALKVHAEYDHELRAGTRFQSLDYRVFGLGEPASYLSMEQSISTSSRHDYRHLLYRGWVELKTGPWTARFGRQRIAWGTGKFWNPVDFLNPYQPTSLEREERRGVDAALLSRGIGLMGRGELVYALADRWPAQGLLARFKSHVAGADASLLGGKVAASTGSWMAGGDFSTDLKGGNLHGEWSYTEPVIREPYWKYMLGYEYTFSSEPKFAWLKDLWVAAEYFHNGRGRTDTLRYDFSLLRTGREVALARDYAGLGLKKELHPLVDFELYQITNLSDESYFVSPSLSCNPIDNLYLAAGWQYFAGSKFSEYGRVPNISYLQGQYFF